MSSAEISSPAGQPSITTPIAGPWDSPHVVIRKRRPKEFPGIERFYINRKNVANLRNCRADTGVFPRLIHIYEVLESNPRINLLAPFLINIGFADKTRSTQPAVKFDPRA